MAKILIIEDDADLVETYTDLLEANGHVVRCTSHVNEAIDYVWELEPEVVTLDLNLPGHSSSAISAFINSARALSRCRIIVISGHPEMIIEQGWTEIVDLVLNKPVDNYQLLRMIDRLMSI